MNSVETTLWRQHSGDDTISQREVLCWLPNFGKPVSSDDPPLLTSRQEGTLQLRRRRLPGVTMFGQRDFVPFFAVSHFIHKGPHEEHPSTAGSFEVLGVCRVRES